MVVGCGEAKNSLLINRVPLLQHFEHLGRIEGSIIDTDKTLISFTVLP